VFREGGFNPKKARVRITRSLSGIPVSFEVHEDCPEACQASKKAICVDICPFDALKAEEHEG
jgi:Fe-S-cluster-containing hydrogenase component 2